MSHLEAPAPSPALDVSAWHVVASIAIVKVKAYSNLRASQKLANSKMPDPAMSRLYYALFQAGVHRMHSMGKTPQDFRSDILEATEQKGGWRHGTICGNANLFRGRKDDLVLFEEARGLRVQADYQPTAVDLDVVKEMLPDVDQFVSEVCK